MNMLDLPAERVPEGYTGITYRPGPTKPYTAWVKGRIVAFCASEVEAQRAVRGIKSNGR